MPKSKKSPQRLAQPLEPDVLFKFVSSLKSESPAPTASAFQLWHVGGKEQEFAQHALPNLDADGNVMLPYVQCGIQGCIAAEGHKDEIEEKYNLRLLREQCPLSLSAEELLDHAIKSVAVYHNACVKNPACVHGYHSRVQNTYIWNGKRINRLFFNVVVGRWVRELKCATVHSGDAKKHFPHCHIANSSAIAPSTESLWRLAWQNWRKKEQQQSQQQSEQQEGRPKIVVPEKNSTTASSPSPSHVHHQKKLKPNEPSPVPSPPGMVPSPSARPSPAKKARRQYSAKNQKDRAAMKPRPATEKALAKKKQAAVDGLQSAAEEPSAAASQAVLAPTLDLVATDGSKSQSAEKTEAKKPAKRKKAMHMELAQLAIVSDGIKIKFGNTSRTASSRSEESKLLEVIRKSKQEAAVDGLQSAAEEPSAAASQAVLAPTLDLVATDGSKSQSAEKTTEAKTQAKRKKQLAMLAIGSDGLAKEFGNTNRTASSRSEEYKVLRAIRESSNQSVVKATSLVTSMASVNLSEVPPPPTTQAPLPSALCSLVLMLAGRRTPARRTPAL